jgi:hypothetical protein
MMAVGLLYRMAAIIVFLSWGYLYAIESTSTYWMSYHYLELLVTFLMIWMPAARRLSLDAWIADYLQKKGVTRLSSGSQPGRRPERQASSARRSNGWARIFANANQSRTVPFWTLFLLRGQLVIAYFYAGVAKLNSDWLLDAQPVRYYLSQPRWIEEYGSLLSASQLGFFKKLFQSSEAAYFVSWAGAAFDVSVGFLLLFRRTRIFGFVLLCIFHGTNHFLIFNDIEWFPLLGVLTALIFFEADWPERCWNWLRHPRISKPDWGWFFAGGFLFPIVGASLGWESRAADGIDPRKAAFSINHLTPLVVAAWLAWQALTPARQLLSAGDSRFTWEGLSFSWRLKAEVYRCAPCELILEDAAVVSRDAAWRNRINWSNWQGDPEVFRALNSSRVDWTQLPELLVLLEPMVGQRILYNPFAAMTQGRTEAESRRRVSEIWQEIYGHQPQGVLRTAPATATLSSCAPLLRSRGYAIRTTVEVEQLLQKLLAEHEERELASILRQTHPLGLQGGPDPPVPFLLIEDSSLARKAGSPAMEVESAYWKRCSYTRSRRDTFNVNVGGEPLVIYMGAAAFALREHLPQAALFDSQDHPEQSPYIWWNYLHELTYAEGMHLSMQPFLLREYSRHIAELWESSTGRRPIVRAQTAVSLNFRPSQQVVDPKADLATVRLAFLRHNSWIRQLDYPRIPKAGLFNTNSISDK